VASDVPEFEFLAGAELLGSERRQDPGKGEIPVPGSVAVEEEGGHALPPNGSGGSISTPISVIGLLTLSFFTK